MRFPRLFASLLVGFCCGIACAQQSIPERYLLDAANRERRAAGLAELRWSESLHRAASEHAQWMARENALSHQFQGEPDVSERLAAAGARFSAVAENVAVAPTAAMVHDGWMHSPHHRENLLDPRMTSIGIAAIVQNGRVFAVQDFGREVASLSTDQQEALLSKGLQRAGISAVEASESARAACAADDGFAGQQRPGYLMRWTSTDLNALPGPLQDRIKTGKYHRAEVGACAAQGGSAFSTFRVAVLLFQ